MITNVHLIGFPGQNAFAYKALFISLILSSLGLRTSDSGNVLPVNETLNNFVTRLICY